ncbi:growth hormone secretagogue receptor type 1-like [Palaemon carinicauda]|uniref:growth hormone secretagogue receptor type 1-like n=1 Tax=Palaemon carinicauda TaxID=392227 RepID=UPI0035B5D74F
MDFEDYQTDFITTLPDQRCTSGDCLGRAPSLVTSSPPNTEFGLPQSRTTSHPETNVSDILSDGGSDDLPDISFPTYMKGIYTTWGLLLLLVGVIGNLLVPVVVMRDRELRGATTSVFIVNLVVADLLVLIVCLPSLLLELYAPPAVWILPGSMCKVVPYVEFLVAHASLLIILAISVERYRVICHPLTAAAKCSRARAMGACALMWSIATVVTSPVIVLTEYTQVRYIDNSLVPVCYTSIVKLWAKVFVVSATMGLFFLPLLVLIVLYWRIARQLLLEDKQLCKDKPNPNLQARKQVVVMLGTVVVVFFICLLPYRVFCLWIIWTSIETEQSLGQETYYNLLYAFRVLVYVNSAINPLLYNITSSKFRGAFYRLLSLQRRELMGTSSLHHTSSNTHSSSMTNKSSGSWKSQRLLVRCSYSFGQGEGEVRPLVEPLNPKRSSAAATPSWANHNGTHLCMQDTSSPASSPFLARSLCSRDVNREMESFV